MCKWWWRRRTTGAEGGWWGRRRIGIAAPLPDGPAAHTPTTPEGPRSRSAASLRETSTGPRLRTGGRSASGARRRRDCGGRLPPVPTGEWSCAARERDGVGTGFPRCSESWWRPRRLHLLVVCARSRRSPTGVEPGGSGSRRSFRRIVEARAYASAESGHSPGPIAGKRSGRPVQGGRDDRLSAFQRIGVARTRPALRNATARSGRPRASGERSEERAAADTAQR